ncbi:MAG: Coenzyme F420 hydrogenase/dehydrogenase, beta subunit C-terminal domain [Desulfobacteraceae bacterium]|jgi:formate dehydrogenase subunit beta|nr:Coenzyme F420 hydrogenase/dehydrogenase, beta subunit C-terminal domain [Desulfobacteraceae bacterium]
MAVTAKIDVKDKDMLGSLRDFFKDLLETEEIQSLLVPQHLPMKDMVMPTLVTDPSLLDGVDPLAPAFPMNAAKIVARLTRKPMGAKVAAVLRPCEIRSFVELVKLKQGRTDELILIGMDCLGALQNKDYFQLAAHTAAESTVAFYESVLGGKRTETGGVDLAPACKACEYPVAENADILIGLYGMDISHSLLVQSQTEAGEHILEQMNLPATDAPRARQDAIDAVINQHTQYRDDMFARTRAATDSLEKMSTYFATCVNCYNCRVACPVCYCKECVFVTDVFNHDPSQYLQWANRKGIIKMPTDTLFFHITRLAHMSTACVGCGQCSNACPNDIPVMELFRTIAQDTQRAFDYEAGRSLEKEPPLSVFREEEFAEVVGI